MYRRIILYPIIVVQMNYTHIKPTIITKGKEKKKQLTKTTIKSNWERYFMRWLSNNEGLYFECDSLGFDI